MLIKCYLAKTKENISPKLRVEIVHAFNKQLKSLICETCGEKMVKRSRPKAASTRTSARKSLGKFRESFVWSNVGQTSK